MQWEEDEEDEILASKGTRIPEEKRYNQGRPTNAQHHGRREFPVFEDTFAKRLGRRRSTSAMRGRPLERTIGFSSVVAKAVEPSKRTSLEEIPKSSRRNEVPKVDKKWCAWPCSCDLHSAAHRAKSCGQPISKQSTTKASNVKETKSLGALLSRKIFRPNNNPTVVSYPAWEDEWALFREQHELEMRQMKQMYMGLQEICLELKRMGSQKEDASAGSSSRRHSSESLDSKVGGGTHLGLHSTKHDVSKNHAPKARGNGYHHKPSKRATSAPRTRVNWDTGLSKENSMHVRVPYGTSWYCPTAALFEEIIQVERVYIRNFVAALIKYEDDRFHSTSADTVLFDDNHGGDSLHDTIVRFLPKASFAKPWHLKYGIEAWLSRIVFKEFGKASLVNKAEERGQDARTRRNESWAEFQRLSLLGPVDAINPEGEVYCAEFHVFCNRKFDTLQKELRWHEEWPDSLVKDFLEAMKHVWRAHKLALAFDPIASLFVVKPAAQLDVKFMEPLETLTIFQTDSSHSPNSSKVEFLVNPGFIILKRIIKCQVYLSPDESSFQDSP